MWNHKSLHKDAFHCNDNDHSYLQSKQALREKYEALLEDIHAKNHVYNQNVLSCSSISIATIKQLEENANNNKTIKMS